METQQIERTPAHSINWTHVAHFSPKNSARSNPEENGTPLVRPHP